MLSWRDLSPQAAALPSEAALLGVPLARGLHFAPIDSNGNLTQKVEGADTWTYEWDAENQLKRVLKNSVEQARFAYDPFGRRVEKVAGGVTASYTYDGENILREISGATTLKYIHGLGQDDPSPTRTVPAC